MRPRTLVLVVVFLAVFLLAVPPAREAVVNTLTGRGGIVGPRTSPGPDGSIAADPDALASAADMSLDAYALARAIASEHPRESGMVKRAIGWAIRNEAERRGVSVAALLLGPDGRFGTQGRKAAGSEYAATTLDPHEDDVRAAEAVLAPDAVDPTGGATNFYSPRAQDAGYRQGIFSRDAATVDAEWRGRGLAPVDVAGADPAEVRFYRYA